MCGLFGNIKQQSGKLNLPLFMTLGAFNDTRGGDSCGVFIDHFVYKGIGKESYFSETIYTNPIFDEIYEGKETMISLGHCRKTSVGLTNEDTAQPVIIYNSENPELIDMVLMHNGTLTNYNTLKNKYLENCPLWYTDSYIIAYCIYYNGFDILKEYTGAGAFVIVDYRENREKPTTYFFRGKSIQKYNASASEERPLWYTYDYDTKELWFSSIGCALDAGNYPLESTTFEPNKLYRYNENGLMIIKEIDRGSVGPYEPSLPVKDTRYRDDDWYDNYNYPNTTKDKYSIKSYIVKKITIDEIKCINGRYYDLFGALLDGSYNIIDSKGYNFALWFFKGISFKAYNECWAFIRLLNKANIDSFEEFIMSYPEIINMFAFTKVFDGAYYTCKEESSRLIMAYHLDIINYSISKGVVTKEIYQEKETPMQVLECIDLKEINYNELNKYIKSSVPVDKFINYIKH